MDVTQIPKIELHLHLDGAVPPETMWRMAQEKHVSLPVDTLDEFYAWLVKTADCRDVNTYLARFELPLQLMQDAPGITRITCDVLTTLARQGHIYDELRFAPQLHTRAGLRQQDAIEAVLAGRARALRAFPDYRCGILLCCMCIGPETVVVSLQNGLGNDEVLAQFVDADRILYGSGLIGTELAGPGVCVSKPEKGIQMHFGAVHNNPKADAAGKALEACFRAGGCNASFDEDVRPYIWKKVIANSGYNGVSAVMRLKVKETFADPYGHDIVMHVWKEGCAVAQALGIGDLWPLMEKEEPNIVANLGNYYPSMAQDAVLHQRQTEISVLNGAIARYGARLGVPTPFNTVITQVISCIQNNYDKQYLG